jgi:hypothetical protein
LTTFFLNPDYYDDQNSNKKKKTRARERECPPTERETNKKVEKKCCTKKENRERGVAPLFPFLLFTTPRRPERAKRVCFVLVLGPFFSFCVSRSLLFPSFFLLVYREFPFRVGLLVSLFSRRRFCGCNSCPAVPVHSLYPSLALSPKSSPSRSAGVALPFSFVSCLFFFFFTRSMRPPRWIRSVEVEKMKHSLFGRQKCALLFLYC